MNKIAIIGSNGLNASYGGFDQLVDNIVAHANEEDLIYITQPRSTSIPTRVPKNVILSKSIFDAPGIEGVLFDAICVLKYYFKSDTILFLGAGAFPIALFFSLIKKKKIIVNNGGLEWEREKFSKLAKVYLKFLFNLSANYSDVLILDNKTFITYLPKTYKAKLSTVSYGGDISHKLINEKDFYIKKYPFLNLEYYLSVSRAIKDNNIDKICQTFSLSAKKLVLISNFSSSKYGKDVIAKYADYENIYLIDGLYNKDELDLIRLNCLAYIHTHEKCGTAPSLVEMVIAEKPIIAIDVQANRNTLMGQCLYFNNFTELEEIINKNIIYSDYVPNTSLTKKYLWKNIAREYLDLF
tara:strand:- start:48 stop:1106 length:1059 start_codon:yes stop_codon:yes gene_type:complete